MNFSKLHQPAASAAALGIALWAQVAAAQAPTAAQLHNSSALCGYGYNRNCGGAGQGAAYSSDNPANAAIAAMPKSNKTLAQLKREAAAFDTINPTDCTALENGLRHCYQGRYETPRDPKIRHQYPMVELRSQDADGQQHGWSLQYGRGQLLWTTFWQNGLPASPGSKQYDFSLSAHTVSVQDSDANGKLGAPYTISVAQALQELGLKSTRLKDGMHPQLYQSLMEAEKYMQASKKP